MSEFYAEMVHCYINDNHDEALEKYRKRVERELAWMGIRPNELSNYNCLDVGTGYQAIILAELGCRQVFHRDISGQQVRWLQSYCEEHGIDNIDSQQVDLMSRWDLPEPLDLSFIVGVYHHLPNPPQFLRALWERSREGGKIFLRCYRSGTWSRWLCAYLRLFSCYCTPGLIDEKYQELYASAKSGQFLGDMLDDLFVPEWKCFHPRQFRHDAALLGMVVQTESGDFDLDLGAWDENFRVLMIKEKYEVTRAALPDHFASGQPVDQLAIDVSAYQALGEITQHFSDLQIRAKTMGREKLARKLIDLYQLVRPIRGLQTGAYGEAHNNALTHKTLNERIDRLLLLLRHWSNEIDLKSGRRVDVYPRDY